MTPSPPDDRRGFEIALICALQVEADAVHALFDKFWEDEGKTYGQAPGDHNSYSPGAIGEHNVVLAYMPGMGKVSASGVAASLRSSFVGIKLALIVGICGGAPCGAGKMGDIYLGDVIISTAVIQYDFGRHYSKRFERKDTLEDSLGRPSQKIRSILAKLRTHRYRRKLQDNVRAWLRDIQQELPEAGYPGFETDRLYEASYLHKHRQPTKANSCGICPGSDDQICQDALKMTCDELGCEEAGLVVRTQPQIAEESSGGGPRVHLGKMGSGDSVMKSAEYRDRIAKADNIIAFEMEGAGVWEHFPSIVIKGVCDYADSHKNKEWQGYAAATAAAGMKAFLNEWVPEESSAEQEAPSQAIWHVPFNRIHGFVGRSTEIEVLEKKLFQPNGCADLEQFKVGLDLSPIPEAAQFVAREQELAEMHRLLHGHTTRSVVVLYGLGGIGKTQLAIAYARRHKVKYTAIFWVNVNDQDSLKLSFVNIAQQILRSHPSTSVLASVDFERNLDKVVDAVKVWLSIAKNRRWLIIYDNHDNPKVPGNPDSAAVDIRGFLPSADHGSIIVTTRSSQVTIGRRIQVQKLANVQDGLEILSNTSGRKGIMDDPTAVALVEELDGLPLALSTAGAYLEQVTTSFTEYLRLYKASWSKLQITSPQINSYEDRSLYTTWQLSFDRVERQNRLSAKLLKLWAYFDRQDVWFELLRHGRLADYDWMSQLMEDELSFNKAIRVLCTYGLVDPDSSSHEQVGSIGYSMHSCVHSWTIHVLNEEWDEGLARLALTCTSLEVPQRNADKWWVIQRRLLQHAARCVDFIVNDRVRIEGMEWNVFALGLLYKNQGKLAEVEAEAMFNRALQGYEEALGPTHTSTLSMIHNLGLLYQDQDRLAEAKTMYNQALQGFEEALGPKHTLTLIVTDNLGRLYAKQGELTEAEAKYNQALQGYEEALGPKHISTLDTVHSLGLLYANQGKLAEAEAMYNRALQGYEEEPGPKHMLTLDLVNNLGLLYTNQGKLAEAEAMYNRALQGSKEALGPKYISTLSTVNNLGRLYAKQGELTEAKTMYNQALQGFKEALGPKHILTLTVINNLGRLYARQGELTEGQVICNY